MARNWNYKVVKSQRGMDGRWFSYPAAATFETEAKAREYAAQFAAQQRGIGGTRINVLSRRQFDGSVGRTNNVAEYRC